MKFYQLSRAINIGILFYAYETKIVLTTVLLDGMGDDASKVFI